MKCKYCGKHVRSIAHFMQAHKKLMLSKMRRARGKGKSHHSHRSKGRKGGKVSYTKPTQGYPFLTITLHD